MAKLSDDHIRWILDMDAKGVQSELTKLSSQSRQFIDDNKRMNAEIKAAEKQMKEAEKAMDRLTRAGKQNSAEYNEASRTYEAARDEITSYRQRIQENTRAIEENNRMHNEIIRTMRIEDMTMAQLKQRAKSLEEQLRNTSESAEPKAYAALSNELTVVKNRMGELNSGSQSMFSIFKGGLAVLAGNLMTKAIDQIKEWISAGVEWIKTGIDMAKNAEGVVTAFNKLDNSKRHLADMRDATRETISDLKLMEKTVRANEMGIGIQNMANLLKFAQQQAKKMKTDVDYMANSIVDGLGRKSTMILDNLGISASQVQQEVKKTGDFTAAVLKIVNERLKEQGEEALTGAEKAAQSATKWENAQLRVGQKFQWLGETWDKIKGKMADQINELIGDTRSLSEKYQDQIEKVADLEENTVPLVKRYEELKTKSTLTKDEQTELNRIMNTLSQTIPGVVTEFDKYGNILSINNTQKVYDFIEAEKARLRYMNRDAIKKAEEEVDVNTKKKESTQAKYNKGYWEETITNRSTGGDSYTVKHYYTPEQMKQFQDEIKKYGNLVFEAESALNEFTGKSVEEQINQQKKLIQARGQFTAMNKKELDAWIKNEKNAGNEYLQIAKQIYDQRFGTNPDKDPNSDKTDKAAIDNKALNDIEKRQKEETTSLMKAYSERTITKEEYEKKLTEIEARYIDERFKLAGLDADTRSNIERSYYEFKSRLRTQEDQNEANRIVQAEKQREDLALWNAQEDKAIVDAALKEIDHRAELERVALMEKYANELIDEQQFQDQLLDIERKALEEKLRINGLSEEQIATLRKTSLQKQITDNEQAQRKAEQTAKAYAGIGENFATQLGNILTDQMQSSESSTAEFQYNMLMLALDTLRQIVLLATAEAIAKEIGTKGIAGIATGAVAAAAINLAFAAVKGLIKKPTKDGTNTSSSTPKKTGERVYSGFAEGGYHEGYTGDGGKYEAKGFFPDGQPYHAGEYIIPQEILRMPAVAPIIRQIESARRSYSDKNPLPDGFADGGYHSDTPLNLGGMDSSLIKEFISVMKGLRDKKFDINYYEFENAKKVVDTARAGASKRG